MPSVPALRRLCALLVVAALAAVSVGCGDDVSTGAASPATAGASGKAVGRAASRVPARAKADAAVSLARRHAADRALVFARLSAAHKWEAALRATTTTTIPPTTTTVLPPTTTTTAAPPTTRPPPPTTRPAPPTTRPPAPTAPPTTIARITDRRLFLLTDSVMLGAQYALPKALPTWQVDLDGKVSRFFAAGLDVLRARRREIGQVVVIQVGNNYSGSESQFRGQIDEAMRILTGVRWVVFVTVFEFQPDRAEVNNELRAAAARYPNVRIADWNALERANPGHTSRDGLHLKPSGATLMAGLVADVVNRLPGA